MIANIRQISQQLLNPCFNSPKEVVSWMGAIQGQDYAMAKWAVGIRLKSPTLRAVVDALARGEIIRTHVMRPTCSRRYTLDAETVCTAYKVGQ